MGAYIILFALFAIPAMFFQSRINASDRPLILVDGVMVRQRPPFSATSLWFAALVPLLLIGLRDNVGTDFGAYRNMFDEISVRGVPFALKRIDPGYGMISLSVARLGMEFWVVNLICGALFMFGIIKFATIQNNPWLAVAVAVPYLIIVVGMGYSRQAVAIGLSMYGLTVLHQGKYLKFTLSVLAGGLFHRSAVVLLPIASISRTRNRFGAAIIAIAGLVGGYYLLQSGQGYEHFQADYLRVRYDSKGAAIRLAMSAVSALIFLLCSRRFHLSEAERVTWRNFAIIALISTIALPFVTSSAWLDRLALYLIPLQVLVFANLPTAMSGSERPSLFLTFGILVYSAVIEWTWLFYSDNGKNWLPYQWLLT